MAGGELQAARTGGGHREGQSGALDAAGDVARLVRRVEVPVVRHRVLGEQAVEERYELTEAVGALARGPGLLIAPGERRGVESGAARADAQGDPAVRHVVEGDQFLGEGHRVPEVRRGHEGAQTQPVGDGGGGRQGRYGAEPGAVPEGAPGQVVVGERGVEAQVLGSLPQLLSVVPSVDRKDHSAQTHAPDDKRDRRGAPSGAVTSSGDADQLSDLCGAVGVRDMLRS